LVLENVRVKAAEVTVDIVSQFSEAIQKKVGELGENLAVLVNANNKGYCRTQLDDRSINYFAENLQHIDHTVNRCYLWRILYDHVRTCKLPPMMYIEIACMHLKAEKESQIIPFILEQCAYILDKDLACISDEQ
jgi:hypothetical protein